MAFSSPLSELFARSPIEPMQDHIRKVYDCSKRLIPFLTAVFEQDWVKVSELQHQIARLENEADDMKREIRLNLPKGLFMAIDRRDLLDLLSRQDRIANKTKDIAGIITGRRLIFPDALHSDILIFTERCIKTCKLALKVVNELDELITAGFRGQESIIVAEMIDELDRHENESDQLQVLIRQKMLKLEPDLPAVDVIFMYKIIDWIGGLADNAQLVGDRLEIMVAR